MKTLSVIIPFYGHKSLLDKLVECLKYQTLSNEEFEVLVIDNHPQKILTSNSFYTVYHQPIPGSYAARNLGIKMAAGRFLFFTDSDCLPCKDWLEQGLAMIQDIKGIIAGRIDLQFQNPENPQALELYERVFYFNQKDYVEKESYGATANLIVERSVFEKVGPFDSALRSGGDQEFCQRAIKQGVSFQYGDKVIVKHPTRVQWRDFLVRRIRALSGNIFLLYRSQGFTWQNLREKAGFYWKASLMTKWHGDWKFYDSLTLDQQNQIKRCHFLLTKVDLLVLLLCKLSYKMMKSLTMIDRKL